MSAEYSGGRTERGKGRWRGKGRERERGSRRGIGRGRDGVVGRNLKLLDHGDCILEDGILIELGFGAAWQQRP